MNGYSRNIYIFVFHIDWLNEILYFNNHSTARFCYFHWIRSLIIRIIIWVNFYWVLLIESPFHPIWCIFQHVKATAIKNINIKKMTFVDSCVMDHHHMNIIFQTIELKIVHFLNSYFMFVERFKTRNSLPHNLDYECCSG